MKKLIYILPLLFFTKITLAQDKQQGTLQTIKVQGGGGGGNGTVKSVSKTDGYGYSSTITNPTTTPNISGSVDTVVIPSKPFLSNELAKKQDTSYHTNFYAESPQLVRDTLVIGGADTIHGVISSLDNLNMPELRYEAASRDTTNWRTNNTLVDEQFLTDRQAAKANNSNTVTVNGNTQTLGSNPTFTISGTGTNLSSRSTSSFNDTTSNSSRPVIMSMNYGVTPNSPITNYTDFHAFDFNFTNASANSTGKTSMYQQENTIRFSADSMGLAVPLFVHVQNLGTGYIGSIKNIRINNDMSGSTSGGVGSTFGIYLENGAKGATGYINNQYGMYIDSLTSGAVNNVGYFVGKTANGSGNNYGFYSLSSNNFMKGLTIGNLYSAPTVTIPDTLNSQFIFDNGTNNTIFRNNYGAVQNNGTGSFIGGLTVGKTSVEGSSLFVNTASLNTTNGSGLGIAGNYASNKSVIRISAFAPNLGTYTSDLAFRISNSGTLSEVGRFNSDGSFLVGDSARTTESIFTTTSTSKGSYPTPRLTSTQINSIPSLGTGNKGLTAFDITTNYPKYWDGFQWIENGGIHEVAASASSNLTTVLWKFYTLPVISANRTITMPTGYMGRTLTFWNQNTSGFTWSFVSGVVDAAGNTVTTLTNGMVYNLLYSTSVSKYVVTSVGVPTGTYLTTATAATTYQAKGASGQTTLVAGTKSISVPGVTTSSTATLGFVSIGGTVTTTWQYAVVCTANTVTITALTNAGTTNTSDTSILNYSVVY